ncbi:MAG: hypothetical protein WAQ72_05940, partial [Dethiobacteria bacterium]
MVNFSSPDPVNFSVTENKAAQSQSGILSLFKKINFMDRVNALNGLLERAIEVRDELSLINNDGKDAELSA